MNLQTKVLHGLSIISARKHTFQCNKHYEASLAGVNQETGQIRWLHGISSGDWYRNGDMARCAAKWNVVEVACTARNAQRLSVPILIPFQINLRRRDFCQHGNLAVPVFSLPQHLLNISDTFNSVSSQLYHLAVWILCTENILLVFFLIFQTS